MVLSKILVDFISFIETGSFYVPFRNVFRVKIELQTEDEFNRFWEFFPTEKMLRKFSKKLG